MTLRRTHPLAISAVAAIVLVAPAMAAEEPLAVARGLYASAAYEEALAILDGLLPAAASRDERRSVALYRVLCLVALGRHDDTQAAIDAMVQDDPFHRPAMELPPRLRTAITETRARLLQSLAPHMYAEAKAAFERQDFERAGDGFGAVLRMLDDPDLNGSAAHPPLSDLRTLATGFHDLSAKMRQPAAAPPPNAAPPAGEAAVASVTTVDEPAGGRAAAADTAPPAPAPAAPMDVYEAGHPGVEPPDPIRQELPPYPGRVDVASRGIVEVVVGRDGRVESAVMRAPLPARYERTVLAAAREWRYLPATVGGSPVRFRKFIEINLVPER